ncbi:MAG: DUF1844 domain-containing protein [Acidobacteriota bacterium]
MEEENKKSNKFMPPLDITSLLVPFYTQALIKLGEMEDPLSGEKDEDINFAKRLIDLIELFEKKTKGNLIQEEEKFVESILHNLRMLYLKKANIIKI